MVQTLARQMYWLGLIKHSGSPSSAMLMILILGSLSWVRYEC